MFKGDYIFHYTKSDAAINYILKDKTLKLSNLKYVNDPKESKTWPFKLFCYSTKSKNLFRPKLFEDIQNYILNNSRMLCFSLSEETIDTKKENENLNQGYTYNRMWSQYAENHKGVCLVFDRSVIVEEVKNKYEKSVIFENEIHYIDHNNYVNTNPSDPYMIPLETLLEEGISKYMRKHILKYKDELFFKKHYNWRDEKEYRVVVFNSEKEKDDLISIENSLEGIILGEDFDSSQYHEISKFAKEMGVDLYRIFTRGWTIQLFKIDDGEENVVSLNGISYPTNFYYELLYVQGHDPKGNRKTVFFDFPNDGAVSVIE